MRVVLDTNILARSAYSSTGPAAEILRHLRGSEHILIVSVFILSELERVLKYPRLRRYHGLTDNEIWRYVCDIEAAAFVVQTPDKPAAIAHDPDDDPVIATATIGRADVLCTLDRHFRSDRVRRYCLDHGIDVLTDVELIDALDRADSAEEDQ